MDRLASQQRGRDYIDEQNQLKATGLFNYGGPSQVVLDLQARSRDYAVNAVAGIAQSAANFLNQFGNMVKANGPQGSLVNPDDLGGPNGNGTPPTAGGSAVTAPLIVPCGNTLCQIGVVVPGKPGYVPGNAVLSSGNENYDDPANDASILDGKANTHILDGDGPTSGGHRFGTGTPGKSEFPQSWSDQKIVRVISDIATDPSVKWSMPDARGYISTTVTKEGVDVKVVYDSRNNRVVTGYPTNLPKNPKP